MKTLAASMIDSVEYKGVFAGEWLGSGPLMEVISPVTGQSLGRIRMGTGEECDLAVSRAHQAFLSWRKVPAPVRGEVVRQIGEELRRNKEELASLVTLEMGKTIGESRGEVQEMIDVCDFAVGLSRTIGGSNLPSERRGHRLVEQWHPLGVVGIISAFNFPVAVWSWNLALALVAGDTVVWKPSSNAPLSAIAANRIAVRVLERNGYPGEIAGLVIGRGRDIGDRFIANPLVALVSYTGSVETGRHVGQVVQARFGRPLLELGGNNAAIITPSADLNQALQAVFFGAVGTTGQRCTSTRRVIIHEELYDRFVSGLRELYDQVTIGDPRNEANLMGPMVSRAAVETMDLALERIRAQGGRIIQGGEHLELEGGCYVTPCLVEADPDLPMTREETFAPILYLMKYRDLEQAIEIQNNVPQGLSSAIFTNNLLESELFLSGLGSDCGLANVNTGTSGAEIGGAFGGEKETGGGRESGSDSWKAYMRRQTSVINASGRIELAQGISFKTTN